MSRKIIGLIGCAAAAAVTACTTTMDNPLLKESALPYGAPQFDRIRSEHYLPAFKQAIEEGKAEIDAIADNPEAPTFANTIEALEYSGRAFDRVAGIFYNVMEADNSPQMEAIAEEVAPLANGYEMYISLNDKLFERVKAVYDSQGSLNLAEDQRRLLDKTWRSFVRGGANLSPEAKEEYSRVSEDLSLATLEFSKHALAATNAFSLNVTDEARVADLPQYVRDAAAETARAAGQSGWTFTLSAPSYRPFMQFSSDRELKESLWRAYSSRALGGESDNSATVKRIVGLRLHKAQILGYKTFADYQLEDKMAKDVPTVKSFLEQLLIPSLPAAHREVEQVTAFAREHGFPEETLQPWDFSYWAEKYKDSLYSLSDEDLKPYFRLDSCISAVFGLAHRLYGISFEERPDIPGYHPDVKVYDVRDADGSHLALFYADFFPRESKRAGAWMTEFRGQSIEGGVERRPLVSIVCNFSKPSGDAPSLLTHDELTTFMHEFGHALHGMLAKGRYPSLCGTNVAHDFVELPSQINENWAYEPEYLSGFAKHWQTGETIPQEYIDGIVSAKNYLAAYYQVRQLSFGYMDMAWHTVTQVPEESVEEFEKSSAAPCAVLPNIPGTCQSTAFTHLFSGGYAAGYYAYKWAEVLAADAYSLFEERGVFNTEVSGSFRRNILEMGSYRDEMESYVAFRGHAPAPEALLRSLGIIRR